MMSLTCAGVVEHRISDTLVSGERRVMRFFTGQVSSAYGIVDKGCHSTDTKMLEFHLVHDPVSGRYLPCEESHDPSLSADQRVRNTMFDNSCWLPEKELF